MPGYGEPRKETKMPENETPTPAPAKGFNAEHVKDIVAVFAGALLVLASQLDETGWAVNWPPVLAAAIGSIIAWSRSAPGGFRK